MIRSRIVSEPTYGGGVAHVSSGSTLDVVAQLPFDALAAMPSGGPTLDFAPNATGPAVASAYQLQPGYIAGININTTNTWAAPGFLEVTMQASAGAAGYISAEVWDMAADLPRRKVGTLGSVDAADIPVAPAWGPVQFWGEVAFPIPRVDPAALTDGGFVMFNAANLTAGTVDISGNNAAGHLHHHIPGGVWDTDTPMAMSVFGYSGQEWNILRGYEEAYGYPGGGGNIPRTLVLDDGRRYSVLVLQMEGSSLVKAVTSTTPAWAGDCVLSLAVLVDLDQVGVTP